MTDDYDYLVPNIHRGRPAQALRDALSKNENELHHDSDRKHHALIENKYYAYNTTTHYGSCCLTGLPVIIIEHIISSNEIILSAEV